MEFGKHDQGLFKWNKFIRYFRQIRIFKSIVKQIQKLRNPTAGQYVLFAYALPKRFLSLRMLCHGSGHILPT